MKQLIQLVMVSALVMPMLSAQGQRGLEAKFPQYKVTLPVTLEGNADREMVPLVDGKLDRLPKKSEQSRFGIFYKQFSNALGTTPVVEIIDGANDQVIKTVTLEEYFGKESASWKRIAAESKSSPTSIVSAYSVREGSYDLKIIRSISAVDAREIPAGKNVTLSFSVQSKSPLKVKARFMGVAEGTLTVSGTTLSITADDTLAGVTPALVLHAEPNASIQSSSARQFSIGTGPVDVKANQLTPVLSLKMTGTTIGFREHIKEQVTALEGYYSTGTTTPNLVATIVPSKRSGSPGDTITYTVYYHNIGTAAAVGVKLTNPIPSGARYVEGSAKGAGSDFSLKRVPSTPPNVAEVSEITWTLKNDIAPGQERSASYKVILK